MKLTTIALIFFTTLAQAVSLNNPDYREFRLDSEVRLVEIGSNLAKLEVFVKEYRGPARDDLELTFDAILDKTAMLEQEIANSQNMSDTNFYLTASEIKADLQEVDIQIKRLLNTEPELY